MSVTSSLVLISGRLQLLRVQFLHNNYIILNVHIPHNFQNIKLVLDAIEKVLNENRELNVIMCGDWNYVDDVYLDSKNRTTNNNFLKVTMKRLLSNFNFRDSFRFLHPSKVEFSHAGNQYHKPLARLDRIYINAVISSQLILADLLPSFSDHGIARVGLNFKEIGTFIRFKFDNRTLSDELSSMKYENILDRFLGNTQKDFDSYEQLKWDLKKAAIQIRNYNNFRKKLELKTLKYLNYIDKRLIFERMTEDVLINTESDSTPKKCQTSTNDISIHTAFKNYDNESRSKIFVEFFTSKFLHKDTSIIGIEEYLQDLPKIDPISFQIIDSPLTETEIEKAIDELSRESSPGLDGLTSEFIRKFKKQFIPIFLWLWDETVAQNILPESLRCGLLSLIYKKGDPT